MFFLGLRTDGQQESGRLSLGGLACSGLWPPECGHSEP